MGAQLANHRPGIEVGNGKQQFHIGVADAAGIKQIAAAIHAAHADAGANFREEIDLGLRNRGGQRQHGQGEADRLEQAAHGKISVNPRLRSRAVDSSRFD
ncbi:hypothetical protein D9M68_792780 [compost metagenome]